MFYINGSSITKTFHGVTFNPGETKEVFGIINDPCFVQSSTRKEPPKCDRSNKSESQVVESDENTTKKRTRKQKSSYSSVESESEETTADLEPSTLVENKEV